MLDRDVVQLLAGPPPERSAAGGEHQPAYLGGPAAAQWLTAGLAVPVVYLAGVIAVAAALARGVPATVRARIPLVLAAMHMAWGAGFLSSPRGLHRKSDARVGQPGAATESAAPAGAE